MRDAETTFESFFREHYDPVRRSLAVAFGDPLVAEELAQDAFARALASWGRVSSMERPAGWIYVVALRSGRRRRPRRDRAVVSQVGDLAVDVATRVSLDEAISRLPERQRVVLVLRFLADLSLVDVAAAMGCAVGTVKSTLHVALERLGETMDEEEWHASR